MPDSAAHPVVTSEANGVTDAAVRFITSSRYEDLPPAAVSMSLRCILDTVGLYAAGLREPSTRIVVEAAGDDGGRPDSFLLSRGDARVPAQVAARVLGQSAHAHDFDDTQVSRDPSHVYGLLTHPSTAPLSATLAIADSLRNVSGQDLITAFNTGFEVSCKISEWLKPDHYLRGHHSSGTVATFGAATSAAWLLRLDAQQTAHALGLAAAMAAGVRCSFGTMAKPWHVARASENGVLASLMAKRGFTADPHALDGRWGFPEVLAGGFTEEKLSQGFGATWSILDPGVSIKPYPSGILTHQAMDMVLTLVRENDVRPEVVERVDFYAGDNILNPIRYHRAQNGLQAKFSMAALISMLILHRHAGVSEFEDAAIQSEPFQAMQAKISTHVDPNINAMGFDLIRSRVEISLKSGTVLTAEADTRYRGGPDLPMSDAELEDKFRLCCDRVEPSVQNLILKNIRDLSQLSDVRELLDALRLIDEQ